MKVITEERLRGLINKIIDRENAAKDKKDRFIFGVLRVQLSEIIEACQELDTLTVKRLRPMSELISINDYSYFVLAFKDSKQEFVRVRQSSNDEVFCTDTGKFHNINRFKGFIPMPKYEPEKV